MHSPGSVFVLPVDDPRSSSLFEWVVPLSLRHIVDEGERSREGRTLVPQNRFLILLE